MEFTVERLSEDSLLLRFGEDIDAPTNARVHAAARILRRAALRGVADIAPAYASLLIRFCPPPCDSTDAYRRRVETVARCLAGEGERAPDTGPHPQARRSRFDPGAVPRCLEIPVCYGGDSGPDLAAVAAHAGLTPAAVVARHTAAEYTVAMLGFAPGFPYLLGLDRALHTPRRATPRTHVPAGSIAIGGGQTGIYPRELPGGWNLIGRTPYTLFDVRREPPALLGPGDHVRFRNVGDAGFPHRPKPDA